MGLINKLVIDYKATTDMSLAEIYSHKQGTEILLHTVPEDVKKEKLGFV